MVSFETSIDFASILLIFDEFVKTIVFYDENLKHLICCQFRGALCLKIMKSSKTRNFLNISVQKLWSFELEKGDRKKSWSFQLKTRSSRGVQTPFSQKHACFFTNCMSKCGSLRLKGLALEPFHGSS